MRLLALTFVLALALPAAAATTYPAQADCSRPVDLGTVFVVACTGGPLCESTAVGSVCVDPSTCPAPLAGEMPEDVCRAPDSDFDGYSVDEGDCDDSDASVFPHAPEHTDGVDNDCDGLVDEDVDQDGDGWTSDAGDCDDADPGAFPGNPGEHAQDRIDSNCNGHDDS